MSRQKKAPPELGSWRAVFQEVFNPVFILWLVLLAVLTFAVSHTVRGAREERQQLIRLLEEKSPETVVIDQDNDHGDSSGDSAGEPDRAAVLFAETLFKSAV